MRRPGSNCVRRQSPGLSRLKAPTSSSAAAAKRIALENARKAAEERAAQEAAAEAKRLRLEKERKAEEERSPKEATEALVSKTDEALASKTEVTREVLEKIG